MEISTNIFMNFLIFSAQDLIFDHKLIIIFPTRFILFNQFFLTSPNLSRSILLFLYLFIAPNQYLITITTNLLNCHHYILMDHKTKKDYQKIPSII